MERYEFEDQISDYIENNLSLKKRKIFVEYLKNNQDAQELVDEIENNIKKLNNLPKIVTSPDFNDHVNTAIKDVGLNSEINKSSDEKSLFGFTYLQGGLLISFIFLFGFIGQYLIFNEKRSENSSTYFSKMKERNIEQSLGQNEDSAPKNMTDTIKDTLQEKQINIPHKKNFNKIKLVNN